MLKIVFVTLPFFIKGSVLSILVVGSSRPLNR